MNSPKFMPLFLLAGVEGLCWGVECGVWGVYSLKSPVWMVLACVLSWEWMWPYPLVLWIECLDMHTRPPSILEPVRICMTVLGSWEDEH